MEALVRGEAKPYEVATALMHELGRRASTVLVLEDVHWADEATLDVIRLLGRKVEGVPALVLVSYRDELDRVHPLRVLTGELSTGPVVRRLRVDPLSPDAVARLAAPHGVDAEVLYRRTGGNPFFVTEVLAAADAEIPNTVRDAVLARAARLSPEARDLLEAVAAVPPPPGCLIDHSVRPARAREPASVARRDDPERVSRDVRDVAVSSLDEPPGQEGEEPLPGRHRGRERWEVPGARFLDHVGTDHALAAKVIPDGEFGPLAM